MFAYGADRGIVVAFLNQPMVEWFGNMSGHFRWFFCGFGLAFLDKSNGAP